jgi:hypothetical protein
MTDDINPHLVRAMLARHRGSRTVDRAKRIAWCHENDRHGVRMRPDSSTGTVQFYPYDCPRRMVITAPRIIDVFDESDEAAAS